MSNACLGYLTLCPASNNGTSLILSKCSVFATLLPVAHFATTQLFTPHHFATSLCDILNSSFNFASKICACPTFSLLTLISSSPSVMVLPLYYHIGIALVKPFCHLFPQKKRERSLTPPPTKRSSSRIPTTSPILPQ